LPGLAMPSRHASTPWTARVPRHPFATALVDVASSASPSQIAQRLAQATTSALRATAVNHASLARTARRVEACATPGQHLPCASNASPTRIAQPRNTAVAMSVLPVHPSRSPAQARLPSPVFRFPR
jgi:hypothetical protein